jgi:DNA-binding transcriptional MerR regulator
MEQLTIGAFARLTHLTPKALRLYDQQQLLPPAQVDPDTGYRWYSPEQVPRARRVALLRSVGMPLARIRCVLDLPDAEAARDIAAYWAGQEQAVVAGRAVIGLLVDQLTGRTPTMPEITVRDVAARTVASRTEEMAADAIPAFVGRMFAQLMGPDSPIADYCFVRYRTEFADGVTAPVEFCAPIDPARAAETRARFPGMTVADEPAKREAVVAVGNADAYTALGFEALHQWLAEHDETSDWVPRQTFLRDPASAGPDEPVYELAITLV